MCCDLIYVDIKLYGYCLPVQGSKFQIWDSSDLFVDRLLNKLILEI